MLNANEEASVLIYLENKNRRVNKYNKYNYKVMTAFNVDMSKDDKGKDIAKIGNEI